MSHNRHTSTTYAIKPVNDLDVPGHASWCDGFPALQFEVADYETVVRQIMTGEKRRNNNNNNNTQIIYIAP